MYQWGSLRVNDNWYTERHCQASSLLVKNRLEEKKHTSSCSYLFIEKEDSLKRKAEKSKQEEDKMSSKMEKFKRHKRT